jgi:hypothetical protein
MQLIENRPDGLTSLKDPPHGLVHRVAHLGPVRHAGPEPAVRERPAHRLKRLTLRRWRLAVRVSPD